MVNERQPPRILSPQKPSTQRALADALQDRAKPALQDRTNHPQFGKASPLHNPLKHDFSIFNVPKPNQPRIEQHRHAPAPTHHGSPQNPAFRMPSYMSKPPGLGSPSNTVQIDRPSNPISKLPKYTGNSPGLRLPPDVVEVARPINLAAKPILPLPRPIFSTGGGFQPVNAWKAPSGNVVDLTTAHATRDEDDGFDPDKALGDDKFMGYDPYNYIDAAQASENIKALLEGAFEEDEDEKPKARLRKKKKHDVVAALADNMEALTVEAKEEETHEEEEEEDDGSVDGLSVKLLPHQIDGVAWMMDKEIGERKRNGVLPKGGILADDMGLGKTIQALSLILTNPRPSKLALAKTPKLKIPDAAGRGTLVVAPLALIKQWESEIKTKVEPSHQLKVLVHHGSSRTKRFEDLKKYDVVITTYQTLTSEKEGSSDYEQGLQAGCFGIHWYRVILDEAHSIKNRTAKMTQAACKLRAVYRWCLTGTPMQNNLDELQSLIHFLRIKPYNELKNWRDQISGPMKNGRGGLAMKRLQYFLKAFMKRRTKEVLKKEGGLTFGRGTTINGESKTEAFKIVARNVQTVVVEFDPEERKFYDRLAARTEKSLEVMMGGAKTDYIGALVLLLRLRQICNHPELIRGNLRKEKDSMAIGSRVTSGSQTPRRIKSSSTGDMDDMAEMFGAMSVETKKCDICQNKLTTEEVSGGAIRCSACEGDLEGQSHRPHIKKHGKRGMKASLPSHGARRGIHTRRIIDSDDEEEGDWIVPKAEQSVGNLGKAGGSDDEDAEGGGEWLKADDSNTEDDSVVKVKKFSRRSKEANADISEADDFDGAQDEDDSSEDNEVVMHHKKKMIISTKIRRLLRILDEESEDHKFIVFSEFTSMLDLIEPFLRKQGFRFVRYDGSMKNDDREASLNTLRNDPRTRILLCSLRCGSLGLNLTAASRVVILEPFWNPFVEEQAIDRVHRLNQTVDVTVYRLTVANSVEERIFALQEKKRELAKAALEGGKAVAKLSMKDILDLFRKDAESESHHEHGGDGLVGAGAGDAAALFARPATPSVQIAARPREKIKAPGATDVLFAEAIYGRRW